MMRKLLVGLMSLGMAIGVLSMTVQAEELQEGDYMYQVLEDGTVEITDYIGRDTEVIIPEKIGGCDVTSIGEYTFWNCQSITNITIPDTVTNIGDEAFGGCYSLKNLTFSKNIDTIGRNLFNGCFAFEKLEVVDENPNFTAEDGVLFNKDKTELLMYPRNKADTTYTIPNSVTTIGESSFNVCNNLTTITIPDSVTTIEAWAFSYCDGLKTIEIPKSVTVIGDSIFIWCEKLECINVAEDNQNYVSVEGVLFNKDKTRLIAYPGYSLTQTYVVPDGVEIIEADAFEYTNNLVNITIPEGVTSIGENAFGSCNDLITINIPKSVTDIGVRAFASCSNLESVTIQANITTLETRTFAGCINLKSVVLPEGLKHIGDYVFDGCRKLDTISLPESLLTIGVEAFLGCYKLEEIILPDNLISIGDAAFDDTGLKSIVIPKNVSSIGESIFVFCTNLEYINVAEDNSCFKSVDGILFDKNETILITYPAMKEGEAYTIPESVAVIEDSAFSYCVNLKILNVPKSIKEIKNSAFSWTSLTDIYYDGTKTEWNNIEIDFSSGISESATIHYNFDMIFEDVTSTDWFYNSVDYVCENEFMIGFNSITFAPFDTLTRAQFAIILYRMNGAPEVTYSPVFTDVEEGAWYADAVLWAYNNNIVSGYNNGTFGPFDTITREQMVVMMYRYAASQSQDTDAYTDISVYADAEKVSPFAQDAIKWAVGNSIIGANGAGSSLNPQGKTMRGECAVIIQRFMENQKV